MVCTIFKEIFRRAYCRKYQKLGYKKIVLIMFPKMKENIVDIENSVTRYLQNLFWIKMAFNLFFV